MCQDLIPQLGSGALELVVKLCAALVVSKRHLCAISTPSFLPAASFFPGISVEFKPYGSYKIIVQSLLKWKILLCSAQHPWICSFLLSSCLPLTEVATEPVCVAGVNDELPTQAWGSPQPVWFLWQQPNTPVLLIPSGLWCNSQLYAVALFSVG